VASPYRVLIADDHAIVRNALRSLLEGIENVDIVGEADDGLTAIALTKKLQPDLLLLDVMMPGANGVAVVGEVKRWSPATRVVVITGVTAEGTLRQFRDLVAGLMLKSCTPQELDYGLRRIMAGESYISERLRQILAEPSGGVQLTMRERQVLALIAQGQSNAEIAQVLNLSAKTADNHRTNIMRKLDVHSTAELVAFAFRQGMAEP
jgi:DNA-binding NarL/FixJ family response regulator